MNRREIASEISKRTLIKQSVVSQVLDSLADLMMEELVNTGRFSIPNIFTAEPKPWKGYISGAGTYIPDHERIRIHLSNKVRKLYRLKRDYPDVEITADTWRHVYDTMSELAKGGPSLFKNAPNANPVTIEKDVIPPTERD